MSEPVFISALASQEWAGITIGISEVTDRGMIDLRGDAGNAAFRDAVVAATGVELPTAPRTSATGDDVTVLWLSPDQWLVCCPRKKAPQLHAKLAQETAGQHAFAVDVSDARCILRLEGNAVRSILMKSMPVDLTAPEVVDGFVRRVAFANVAGLMHVIDTRPDVFEIYVFRSYAKHVSDWLAETAGKSAVTQLYGRQAVPAV